MIYVFHDKDITGITRLPAYLIHYCYDAKRDRIDCKKNGTGSNPPTANLIGFDPVDSIPFRFLLLCVVSIPLVWSAVRLVCLYKSSRLYPLPHARRTTYKKHLWNILFKRIKFIRLQKISRNKNTV